VNVIVGTKLGVISIHFRVQNLLKIQQNLRLVVHGNQLTFLHPLLLGEKLTALE
jgi:hypothetical protein